MLEWTRETEFGLRARCSYEEVRLHENKLVRPLLSQVIAAHTASVFSGGGTLGLHAREAHVAVENQR